MKLSESVEPISYLKAHASEIIFLQIAKLSLLHKMVKQK